MKTINDSELLTFEQKEKGTKSEANLRHYLVSSHPKFSVRYKQTTYDLNSYMLGTDSSLDEVYSMHPCNH